MEGNGHNRHPKAVKVGKNRSAPRQLSPCPLWDFGVVPRSPCVPGSSPPAVAFWCSVSPERGYFYIFLVPFFLDVLKPEPLLE